MKKIVSALLALVSVICLAFAFAGCVEEQNGEDQSKTGLYVIDKAYERGWLNEDDLKSIACRHYEINETEENPYLGMFTQKTEIGVKEENEIKTVFCDKFNNEGRYENKPIIDPSDVEIVNYYGTYDGNVVAEINYGNTWYFNEKQIGGVIFNDYKSTLYVLHYFEYCSNTATVAGSLHNLETAYEKGYINEDALKSISCFYYDLYEYEENPYSGLYEPPAQNISKETQRDIKQAFLKQIAKKNEGYFDEVVIVKYYGTTNGNIIVSLSGDIGCRFPDLDSVVEIGGVTFVRDSWYGIYVYKK